MTAPTAAELLHIRMDALFTYADGRMQYVNEPWRQTVPAPLFHAGRTAEGEVLYRFGQQTHPEALARARALLSGGIWDAEAYLEALGGGRAEEEVCFWYPGRQRPRTQCRCLVPTDAALLSETFPGYEEELPFAVPYLGCFRDGRIVSICRSVRMGRGFEAGIATLPAYRRQGCALDVLHGWTAAVLDRGVLALYSANLQNTASCALAEKAGFLPYAQTLEIWR